MIKKYILPVLVIGIAALCFTSCDSETIDVGAEVLTNTTFTQLLAADNSVSSQQLSLTQLQTNNYIGNRFLGTLQRNTTTGISSYGLLCRVNPTASTALTDTVAGQTIQSVKIKSAVLILPYNYELVETTGDTISNYKIIGGEIQQGQPLELEVFKSNHNIIFDSSATNDRQPYFSNTSTLNAASEVVTIDTDIEAGGDILDNVKDNVPTSETFSVQTRFRNSEGQLVNISSDSISNAFEQEGRSLRIQLKSDFLGEKFADASGNVTEVSLFTTTAFYENFKGIYLKPSASNTNLVAINPGFSGVTPKVEITFEVTSTFEKKTGEGDSQVTTTTMQTIDEVVDFEINRDLLISTISFSNSAAFDTEVTTDENMVIKSGVSTSVVSVFQEENTAKEIFEQNPIINQATLRLYVDVESPLYKEENVPKFLWLNFLESGNLLSGAELQEGDNPYYEFLITRYMRRVMNSENVEQLLNQEFDFTVSVSNSNINEEVFALEEPLNAAITQSLSVFNRNQQQRINAGILLSLNEVPLHGSGATNTDLKPQLVVNYSTLN